MLHGTRLLSTERICPCLRPMKFTFALGSLAKTVIGPMASRVVIRSNNRQLTIMIVLVRYSGWTQCFRSEIKMLADYSSYAS